MTTATPFRIEPCELATVPTDLADLIAELARRANDLGTRLHPLTAGSLADLVRVMNCYYSNLIEGHNTRPRDIERALSGDLSPESERRSLQLEALAHIEVQREIDAVVADPSASSEPASVAFLSWVHHRFYSLMPAEFRQVSANGRTLSLVPGAFRANPAEEVSVGRHQPPSSARVTEFMQYFERRFRLGAMGTAGRILAMAIAHHRLNYIHPFVDGNGRVSRLMSHAIAARAGIGAHGLWSISRGLARGLHDRGEYARMMDLADTPRRDDLDGRGNLSLSALEEFVRWFLKVALDQLEFMTALFDLRTLNERLRRYLIEELRIGEAAAAIVDEVLVRGEIARGDASRITGLKDRAARSALGALVEHGLLASASPKGPVSLRFPEKSRDALFPRLFLGTD